MREMRLFDDLHLEGRRRKPKGDPRIILPSFLFDERKRVREERYKLAKGLLSLLLLFLKKKEARKKILEH